MIRFAVVFAALAVCMWAPAHTLGSPLTCWLFGLGVPAAGAALYALSTRKGE